MKLLENKTAIITGASRGIGRGIAQTLAKHGCSIAFTFNTNIEAARSLVNELNTIGVKAKAYKSNAADFDAANKLVEDVVTDFNSLEILILGWSIPWLPC